MEKGFGLRSPAVHALWLDDGSGRGQADSHPRINAGAVGNNTQPWCCVAGVCLHGAGERSS